MLGLLKCVVLVLIKIKTNEERQMFYINLTNKIFTLNFIFGFEEEPFEWNNAVRG